LAVLESVDSLPADAAPTGCPLTADDEGFDGADVCLDR
jgi:hypothetical protein